MTTKNMTTKNVSVIPATRRTGSSNSIRTSVTKLRVAAYCRVSSDDEEQLSSYAAQVSHYTEFIQQNIEWEFAGIYADEAISGTNTKKRLDFHRLIDDCMAGKIDYIITKSVSRFARNTLDCLNYTRKLKDKNIPVFFEKENILSTDSKGELMLTIMASIAQEESRSTSQNVKMGFQYRFQKGEMQINHNRFLGYTKNENKQLVIEPKEAEVVKRIFREYLEGESLNDICKGLELDKILTGAGLPKWRPETVRKMLINEKYVGDALLQKTYTIDFLQKKRVVNNEIVPQYYVENSHEAIIPRDLFMQTQDEMKRRKDIHNNKTDKNNKDNINSKNDKKSSKRVYSSKYALSSIVFCGQCGEIYRRVHWNNRGKKSVVWRCVSRLETKDSDCTSRTISEEELQNAVLEAINRVITDRDGFISMISKNIETVIKDEVDTNDIDSKLRKLQNEIMQHPTAKSDYDNLAGEIHSLRSIKQDTKEHNAQRQTQYRRISEMAEFLAMQSGAITEYDDKLTRQLVERITIFNGKFQIAFKSGVEMEVVIRLFKSRYQVIDKI